MFFDFLISLRLNLSFTIAHKLINLCIAFSIIVLSVCYTCDALAAEQSNIFVIDGDTVRHRGERLRLLDIDAPEIFKPRCVAEVKKGFEAKARLRHLLNEASRIDIEKSGKVDKYDRALVRIYINGVDVAKTLMEENLATHWSPGRKAWKKRKRLWCGDDVATVYVTPHEKIKHAKKRILRAAEKWNASDQEKSLLLAVASIETEAMQADYPICDAKTGDACNVGIFKMNVGMIKTVTDLNALQMLAADIEQSVKIFLLALRKYGVTDFLRYHRGGESGYNGTLAGEDMNAYLRAVDALAEIYLADKNQLNPHYTDGIRVSIFVAAI